MNQDQAISPEEYAKLVKENCPFCKIAKGEIPANKVYEDDKVLAFLDINPANAGHTLVIPKDHSMVLPQMSDGDISHLFKVVKRLAGLLFELIQRSIPDKPAGVNILQNNGAAAGQQVPHTHVHIIPRLEGDGILPTWQPKKIGEQEMKDMQTALSAGMKNVPPVQAEAKVAPAPAQPQIIEPKQPTPEAAPKEQKKPEPKEKPLKRKPRSP